MRQNVKNCFKKLSNFRDSIMGKIITFFLIMFFLMLIPTLFRTYTSFEQARAYKEMIDNIAYTNELNTDVMTKIEPLVWGIVAGKVKFEDSGILPLISNLRERMNYIKNSEYSFDNSGIIEISLRALSTLEDYVDMLGRQIYERKPVADNESTLEEIRVCVSIINDLLQEFSSKQLVKAAIMNEEISHLSNFYFSINILMLIIVIIVGLFAFWYISKSILEPISKLLDMSNKISMGDFGSRVELGASGEFNELALGMNAMSKQIEILIENSVEEQKQIRMLEAKALQAQITPHFLYNTLDAIIWAAEDKNTVDVIKLVTALSSFFRISLSHGIDFITIANEIAHVKSYLDIQQMRYSDILSYEIHVDNGLENYKILKLLLQPLVENSIYHGIKNTRERGKITIRVTKIPEGACFSVADTGIGMKREELDALTASLENDSGYEAGHAGYGIFNVNRRLKLYYEGSQGIEVSSEYRKGTEVSFIINI